MPNYDSVACRQDLTEEEKETERAARRQKRIDWANQDLAGMTVEERLARLEALVFGMEPPV